MKTGLRGHHAGAQIFSRNNSQQPLLQLIGNSASDGVFNVA
jgi:hypothetical protein